MRARCLNPNTRFYSDYGGRGITICREWDSFEQFLADMGPRPTVGHELDRINNDGPYASWNCRWATKAEQSRNRRNNVFLEWNGERKTLAEWVRAVDVPEATLRRRLRDGWPIERVLGTPRKATSR
jgi:hypothetical protein